MMLLARLNDEEQRARQHLAARVRSIHLRKLERREARALIAEAQRERDNMQGDSIRAILREL